MVSLAKLSRPFEGDFLLHNASLLGLLWLSARS